MSSGSRTKARLVLFVEDDETIRTLYANALRERGILVDEVSLLGDAMEVAPNGRPDLVIVDRHLPDGDGWDLVRHLKSREDTRNIPVIAFTANKGRADVEHALVAGCDILLAKPCAPLALVRHVEALLDLAAEEPPSVVRIKAS